MVNLGGVDTILRMPGKKSRWVIVVFLLLALILGFGIYSLSTSKKNSRSSEQQESSFATQFLNDLSANQADKTYSQLDDYAKQRYTKDDWSNMLSQASSVYPKTWTASKQEPAYDPNQTYPSGYNPRTVFFTATIAGTEYQVRVTVVTIGDELKIDDIQWSN